MKEIELTQNPTNLKVYYNDAPNIKFAPKDILDVLMVTIEAELIKLIQKKDKKLHNKSKVQKSTKNVPP